MTGPKITVEADVSAVMSELGRLQKALDSIGKSSSSPVIDQSKVVEAIAQVEAKADELASKLKALKDAGTLDPSSAKAYADALDQAAQAAQAVAAKHGISAGSGIEAVARQTEKMASSMERAAKVRQLLEKEGFRVSTRDAEQVVRRYEQLASSGARGSRFLRKQSIEEFIGGGWERYSVSRAEARRYRDSVLGLPEGDGKGPGGGGKSGAASLIPSLIGMSGIGTLARGVLSLAASPAGLGIGGFAAIAAGVISKEPAAEDEAIQYTDLRASIGALKNDFGELRSSIWYFTQGLGVAHDEAAQLARTFAKTANVAGEDGLKIGEQLRTLVSFGRGYGIDAGTSTQYGATMRQFGVAQTDFEQRRLATMIAEAVTKGGLSAKTDEVLQLLQSYTAATATHSLTTPMVGDYLGYLSSLVGRVGGPGLENNPRGAAGILMAADAALRHGGAFGEASKNFSLGLYQSMIPGFTALDMEVLNEQGAFGNFSKAFGRDSPAYLLAKEMNDKAAMSRYERIAAMGGSEPILAIQLRGLERRFGSNAEELANQTASHLGISVNQASALIRAYRKDPSMGGLETILGNSGIDISKLDMKRVASLAGLAAGDEKDIREQAKRLMSLTGKDALSEKERAELSKANGDPEALRAVVLRLTAMHDTTRDEGEIARQQRADMVNAMQELATKLIPLVQWIRDGIVEIVRYFTPDSDFVKKRDAEKWERYRGEQRAKDTVSAYDTTIATIDKAIAASGSEEEKAKLKAQKDELIRKRNDAILRAKQLSSSTDATDSFKQWTETLQAGTPDPDQSGRGEETSSSLPSPQQRAAAADLAKKVVSPSQYDDLFKQAAEKYGVDWKDLKAIAVVESGLNPTARHQNANGTTDRGLMQLNSRFDRDRGVTDPFDPQQNVFAAAKLYADLLRQSGGDKWQAFKRYNGTGLAAENYADRLMAVRTAAAAMDNGNGESGAVPSASMGQRDSKIKVEVGGNLTVVDPSGVPTGQSVPLMASTISGPVPSGVRP